MVLLQCQISAFSDRVGETYYVRTRQCTTTHAHTPLDTFFFAYLSRSQRNSISFAKKKKEEHNVYTQLTSYTSYGLTHLRNALVGQETKKLKKVVRSIAFLFFIFRASLFCFFLCEKGIIILICFKRGDQSVSREGIRVCLFVKKRNFTPPLQADKWDQYANDIVK